jgi:hypothetical protein
MKDRREAYRIAEFMLNCIPPSLPPSMPEFEEYVEARFRDANGHYKFSCHQDCLIIQRQHRSSEK